MVEQTRLHARPDVLECHRRPVKQFERPGPVRNLHERHWKVQGGPDERLERGSGDFVAQEVGTDGGADLHNIGPAKAGHGSGRQAVQPLRHVEAAVRRRAGKQGVNERNRRRSAARTDPLHSL
jgi:hypothetical protein